MADLQMLREEEPQLFARNRELVGDDVDRYEQFLREQNIIVTARNSEEVYLQLREHFRGAQQ